MIGAPWPAQMSQPADELGMRMGHSAFFLNNGSGEAVQLYCSLHEPRGVDVRGVVVFVHAFAEEMNKSRRMVAVQARALAAAGYCVLQPDLHGCGDSSGDFGDASWQHWVDDIAKAAQWLVQRHTGVPLWLWGHRAGCLLATQAAAQTRLDCNFLFWAARASGKQLLQQFLRLKTAGDMLAGNAAGGADALRAELADGKPVEIAGYRLSAALADGLERAELTPPPQAAGRLEWIDLSTRAQASQSPASRKASAAWQSAGFHVNCQVVEGPSFWQTTEIEEAPALVDATLAAIADRPLKAES